MDGLIEGLVAHSGNSATSAGPCLDLAVHRCCIALIRRRGDVEDGGGAEGFCGTSEAIQRLGKIVCPGSHRQQAQQIYLM